MPDAIKYAGLTRRRLGELGVEFVDTMDINGEGLPYDEGDRLKIEEEFRREGTDRLFFSHCNFGTGYMVAKMVRDPNVPVPLQEPKNERPDESGVCLRGSQCGLSVTGKVLRRSRVPFTCMTNCHLEDARFEWEVRDFLAACNVIRVFKSTRVPQITPRPFDFWSIMCDEGELLERFNIQLAPTPMSRLMTQVKLAKGGSREVKRVMKYCRQTIDVKIKEEELENTAVMKVAMKRLVVEHGYNAVAIQCWNALQGELGIMPYAVNSLLNEEGLSVVCKTDIHGAITTVMVETVAMDKTRGLFTDWTIRHPDNGNGEPLQHRGPRPISVAQEGPVTGYPLASDHSGAVEALAKYRNVTLTRPDEGNDEYPMLMGSIKGIEGPYTKGICLRMEAENLKRPEDKLVCGPYIHHCAGIHKRVVPVLYKVCKYIGMKLNPYDPIEEKVRAYIRGE